MFKFEINIDMIKIFSSYTTPHSNPALKSGTKKVCIIYWNSSKVSEGVYKQFDCWRARKLC